MKMYISPERITRMQVKDMAIGWDKADNKASGPLVVPTGTWTTIRTWNDLPTGPTIFSAELYAGLSLTSSERPKDIRLRLLRVSTNDATKRTGLVIGNGSDWSGMYTGLEWIDGDDLPIALQVWHNCSVALKFTWIVKVYNPSALVAGLVDLDE